MITAFKINRLMGLSPESLSLALERGTGQAQHFKSARFLGITNGRKFCYEVEYYDRTINGDTYSKLFLDLNTSQEPTAEW